MNGALFRKDNWNKENIKQAIEINKKNIIEKKKQWRKYSKEFFGENNSRAMEIKVKEVLVML